MKFPFRNGRCYAVDQQAQLIASLTADAVDRPHLSSAERALIEYADELTRTPASIRPADLDRLRAAGFEDRGIHDVCAIVAYFAFVNRIADGLGVELESPAETA